MGVFPSRTPARKSGRKGLSLMAGGVAEAEKEGSGGPQSMQKRPWPRKRRTQEFAAIFCARNSSFNNLILDYNMEFNPVQILCACVVVWGGVSLKNRRQSQENLVSNQSAKGGAKPARLSPAPSEVFLSSAAVFSPPAHRSCSRFGRRGSAAPLPLEVAAPKLCAAPIRPRGPLPDPPPSALAPGQKAGAGPSPE